MRASGRRRHGDAYDLAPSVSDVLRLDDRIDHKRTAGLHLTIGAVTGMHKHRFGAEYVLHSTTDAGCGDKDYQI